MQIKKQAKPNFDLKGETYVVIVSILPPQNALITEYVWTPPPAVDLNLGESPIIKKRQPLGCLWCRRWDFPLADRRPTGASSCFCPAKRCTAKTEARFKSHQ